MPFAIFDQGNVFDFLNALKHIQVAQWLEDISSLGLASLNISFFPGTQYQRVVLYDAYKD